MNRFVSFTAALCLASTPAMAQIQYGESVPVQIDSTNKLDACSLEQVSNVGDDSSAMVFTGPSSDYDVVDYVADGDLVWVCQSDDDMLGIVYAPAGSDIDCELANPLDFAVNYSGPCNTGWIKSEWVSIVAG